MNVALSRGHIVGKRLTSNVTSKQIRRFSVLTKYRDSNTFLNKLPCADPRSIQTSDRRGFQAFVPDEKDGYRTNKPVSNKQHVIDGFKQLKTELKLWKEEMQETLRADPILFARPGETDSVFEFEKQEDIDKFIVTSDSDHNQGYSHCTFKINQSGYGLFSGVLDSTVPKQGKIVKSGYCNITCLRVMKSFQRDSYFDWSMYNTLVLRVRGDGRPYSLNLHTPGIFDVMWQDMFQYVLYTRGGPHWQLAKIPFSKFFLTTKGTVQDKQCFMPNIRVGRIGITAAGLDYADGPFSLELDFIGVEHDPSNTEEFAYEMYKVPKFIIGNG